MIVCLGIAQLISWGITYYLVGAIGSFIAADFDNTVVFGGFSLGLVTMGLISSAAGRFVDRHGRTSLIIGGAINAAGCLVLASAHSAAIYVLAWVPIGIGMRLSLYDAAFATIARTGSAGAARAIAQITLIGGLASTVFWPVGYFLAHSFGWRAAVAVYAAMALATIPLALVVPRLAVPLPTAAASADAGPIASERRLWIACLMFAAMVTLQTFVLAGVTSHVLAVMADIGVGAAVAISAAAMQGVGQFVARFAQIFVARGPNPLQLAVIAAGLWVLAFAVALGNRGHSAAAYAFMLLFGAGNGLMTIAKGTLPLLMFRREHYGASVGRLIAPGFFLTAAAPTVYAFIDARSAGSAFTLSAGLVVVVFALTLALHRQLRDRARGV